MTITLPDTIKHICLVGDIHGSYDIALYRIRHFKVIDTVFLFCGDVGVGFESLKHYTDRVVPEMHKTLKKFNDIFLFIRGNHDDPVYYKDQLINTNYVKCLPDYTVIKVCNQNILVVGGGISIDRSYRKQTNSVRLVDYMKYHNCDYQTAAKEMISCYWEDEQVIYQPKIDEKINIICSHSAPSFCYPNFKGDFVLNGAEYDETLLADLDIERNTLDKVYNDYKDTITHWYYGHFHNSNVEFINGCKFTLLNICEFKEHDYNN